MYPDEGSVALSYSEVPGLLAAVKEPTSREFQVCDRGELALLSPGMKIVAGVRKGETNTCSKRFGAKGRFRKNDRGTAIHSTSAGDARSRACGSRHSLQYYGPAPDFELIPRLGGGPLWAP